VTASARLDGTGQLVCPGPPFCTVRHARGERHGRAKLTDAQVAALRAAFDAGERQVDLARRYGVGEPCVSYLVRRLRRAP